MFYNLVGGVERLEDVGGSNHWLVHHTGKPLEVSAARRQLLSKLLI